MMTVERDATNRLSGRRSPATMLGLGGDEYRGVEERAFQLVNFVKTRLNKETCVLFGD
jgi:hypothetical protein